MGFDASKSVDSLDYDFAPWVEASGTIPEPRQEQVDALFDALREVVTASGAEIGATPDAIISGLAGLPAEVVKTQSDAMLDALEAFCQGTPSREEIEALPVRPMQAFVGWLVGQLEDPGKGATQPSPVTANGAGPRT